VAAGAEPLTGRTKETRIDDARGGSPTSGAEVIQPASGARRRILVTGGAGYIGSHTVRLLAGLGHAPIVLDTLERGHRDAVDGARLIVGSTGDRALVQRVLREERIEAVIHFAARKSTADSVADPAGYFDHNVGDSIALLSEIVAAEIGAFVFSSSCAVYGEVEASPVAEDAPVRPSTPYGESKVLVERMLPWLEARGLRHVVLRYFNAAGAEPDGSHGEHPAGASSLVPRVVSVATGGQSNLTVYGDDYPTPDGTAIRDYVHVADLARAHVAALEHLLRDGASSVLNLGTGTGSSVLDVVRAVEQAAGVPVPLVMAPRRPGDVAAIWADSREAERVLGWRATSGIEDIAASAVRWAQRRPDGYPDAAGTEGR
jgi:UDP-glucose-4-epimerase GalE